MAVTGVATTVVVCNGRLRELLAHGDRELPVVFDLPTRLGRDSDSPPAAGHVGRTGVAIDSLDDMRVLFAGLPLHRVSPAMAGGAPAAVMLLLYHLVAEERGVPGHRLSGTVLSAFKEYAVGRTHIFPPRPTRRLAADLLAYCRAEVPRWRTVPAAAHTVGTLVRGGPTAEVRQRERIAKLRAWRCQDRVAAALERLGADAADRGGNILYPMKSALAAGATVGEVCDVLRAEWGAHPAHPSEGHG
ncbi:methylmalonyl-CoA mutase family protein [Streptomyces sp. NPDC059781]|uniref:methylmalonyl-CoA mutase family protein n=1 Tax=unclassified Streptomyces TaxID=2593676 RepID=UPI003667F556